MEAKHTDNLRIPQLRIILNTACGKHCLYCRPSGEASHQVQTDKQLSPGDLLGLVWVLVNAGIGTVRLTGGDPALYPPERLVQLVQEVKRMGVHHLSLVTRNGRIAEDLLGLRDAGLDLITFSLDSLDPVRWCRICGLPESRRGEHEALLGAARHAREVGLPVSFNCVLMADTTEAEVMGLLAFASKLGASVKFEELIRDVSGPGRLSGDQLHLSPQYFAALIRAQAIDSWVTCPPGGLGHPMENHRLPSGVTATWKQFAKGTCYGDACQTCSDFPCDDALMALRLLPDGRLQTCLKRDDNLFDLGSALRVGQQEADRVVQQALSVFASAARYEHAEIERLRAQHTCVPMTQVLHAMEMQA